MGDTANGPLSGHFMTPICLMMAEVLRCSTHTSLWYRLSSWEEEEEEEEEGGEEGGVMKWPDKAGGEREEEWGDLHYLASQPSY